MVVVLLAGCRFGFLQHDQAPADSAALPDGLTDADINTQLGPWGTPVPLTAVDDPTYQEDDPTLTSDMLEIYFDTDRPVNGGALGDTWVSTRIAPTDTFGAPTPVTVLVSTADDSTPDLSPDGLRLYLGSDRMIAGDRDIYVSSRADRQSPWGSLVRIPELATTQDDSGVCESADGLSMIFASTRTGNGDLYVTSRATTSSSWGTPQLLAGFDNPEEETQQWCNDDLTLVYYSHRINGQLDIWYASRPSPAAPFDTPQPVANLNTVRDEADPWLSPDLRTMYFYRGQLNGGDIYVTTR